VQSTNDNPDGPLELRVYPGDDCRGSLYQDDGLTFAYQKGEFLRMAFACQVSAGELTISSRIATNAYRPWWNAVRLSIYGAASQPKEVRLGGQPVRGWHYDAGEHRVTVELPDARKDWSVNLHF